MEFKTRQQIAGDGRQSLENKWISLNHSFFPSFTTIAYNLNSRFSKIISHHSFFFAPPSQQRSSFLTVFQKILFTLMLHSSHWPYFTRMAIFLTILLNIIAVSGGGGKPLPPGKTNPDAINCGLRSGGFAIPRISHGETVPDIRKWPWLATLLLREAGDDRLGEICSATVISKRYLLTAAHCHLNLSGTGELDFVRKCFVLHVKPRFEKFWNF